MTDELLAALRCPIDPARSTGLDRDQQALVCRQCRVHFPVKLGVPVLLADGVTTMETVVQIPGESYAAAPQAVKEVFDRGGAFQKLLYNYFHTLFIVASQTAACNRLHHIEARLCRWLLMSSDGVGSDDLALTQEYLAAMLGVRRAGVSETVGRVEERGLVRHSRGRIKVVDRAGLERCACECYRIVKDEYERLLG